MSKLIYSAIMSLDGYIADESGNFDWAAPDEEVHRFVNDLERPIGTHLFGRRMYETMVWWDDQENMADEPAVVQDYGEIYRAADKIVYSRSLAGVSSARTRLEREFDPETVRRMKAASARDISIGGAELAAQAIRAGLVDEYHLFVVPHLAGGGKRALPEGFPAELALVDSRRFANGTVHLHYRPKP